MRVLSLLLFLSSVLAGTVRLEIARAKRAPEDVDVFRHRHRHRLRGRATDNTVEQVLENYSYLYYANVSVGTPGQALRLQIDTGSSDVWVESGENAVCLEASDPCATTGVFEPEDSSTYVKISDMFSIAYGDGSYAKGDYAYETFTIGGATVTNLTIGVATDANSTSGIMGIGFAANEALVGQYGTRYQYKNLPDLMVQQGLIQSRTFSLWLNDLDASTGTVLFGGVDRKKFAGELVELPMNRYVGQSSPTEFFVTLDGVGFTDTDGSVHAIVTGLGEPVLLDSGTSFNYLPARVLSAIASAVSAEYSYDVGYYVQSCTVAAVNASINFGFDGVTIEVPLNELLYPAVTKSGRALTFENGEAVCLLTVLDNTSLGVSILGDTFLRSAYVVYDLDNAVIGLAQTVFNATDSDVVAIASGTAALPGATVVTEDVATLSATKSKAQSAASETAVQSETAVESGFGETASATSASAASETATRNSGASSASRGALVAALLSVFVGVSCVV